MANPKANIIELEAKVAKPYTKSPELTEYVPEPTETWLKEVSLEMAEPKKKTTELG